MAKQSAGGSRGVLGEIESRLAQVERELEGHKELLAERERLVRARAAMTGEPNVKQITQEDVAAFLAEHPGAKAGEIAEGLGVSSGRVSAHLFRGKHDRFISRKGSWYVREEPTKGRGR
jgi:CRP-like cAMP-binding protein